MYCKIDNDTALEMLMDRLNTMWNESGDIEVAELYRQMYESYVCNGAFDNSEFNLMVIVDNDWVNYCDVLCFDNEDDAPDVGDVYESEEYGTRYIEARILSNGEVYCLGRVC